MAATAEKGAVEVQARLQTDQLAERLVAASLDQPRPTTASPGASLSRQVASGTTSTPERVSTHVTQQLLLTVLSESVSSLPDKPMRSAACLPRCRALYLHARAPSVPSCHHAHVHTVDVPTRLCFKCSRSWTPSTCLRCELPATMMLSRCCQCRYVGKQQEHTP